MKSEAGDTVGAADMPEESLFLEPKWTQGRQSPPPTDCVKTRCNIINLYIYTHYITHTYDWVY